MTDSPNRNRTVLALPALAAALVLAGCSATHVGESWQCPLAQGASCDSVAAADPAVPDAGAAWEPVLRTPLYEARDTERPEARDTERPCEAGCGGFDPFAWLARLFGDGDADGAPEQPGSPAPVLQDTAGSPEPATGSPAPVIPRAPGFAEGRAVAPDAVAAPAAAPADPVEGDLRTGETIGRIWIAPFVDADGVYREAFHVRVVLEPAGWRLR